MLGRLLLIPVLVGLGCVLAALYGAIHNQISYTVSPEYFAAFKFPQFDIPPELHNRAGASIVGALASWWMGLIISIPVLLAGSNIPTTRAFVRYSLRAYVVVVVTAMVVGIGGLVVAWLTLTDASVASWWRPEGVTDALAFERAGAMHNASYLGGVVGVLTAGAYQLAAARRLRLPSGG